MTEKNVKPGEQSARHARILQHVGISELPCSPPTSVEGEVLYQALFTPAYKNALSVDAYCDAMLLLIERGKLSKEQRDQLQAALG